MKTPRTVLVSHGLQISLQIGDSVPLLAIADALSQFHAEEIVISALPTNRSHWLEYNLFNLARRLASRDRVGDVARSPDSAMEEPAGASGIAQGDASGPAVAGAFSRQEEPSRADFAQSCSVAAGEPGRGLPRLISGDPKEESDRPFWTPDWMPRVRGCGSLVGGCMSLRWVGGAVCVPCLGWCWTLSL